MSGFAPPSGPPPPKVPAGWKAVWNEQYSEWFFVNLSTKQSQWEMPTAPADAMGGEETPSGGPPGYDHGSAVNTGPEKGAGNVYGQSNAYGQDDVGRSGSQVDEDEKLARKLQAEEESRTASSRGASDSYYNQSPSGQGQYDTSAQQLPARDTEKKKGLLGKLSSKLGGGSSSSRPYAAQQGYPQQGYQQQGGYPQQYPQQGYGYGQQQYAGAYGAPPGGYYQQPQRQRHGLGAGGGAALGAGAGLLGGLLIGDELGQMDDGGGGMDGGGGDMGGGDMGGGDMGGGDMGGGDF